MYRLQYFSFFRLLTGKQFCEEMNHTFSNGEKIFAFVGRSHVAAILPYIDADYKVHYRITDSWDSSDRKIGEYWVSTSMENIQKTVPGSVDLLQKPDMPISVGTTVTHPKYGCGNIIQIVEKSNDLILEIEFSRVGTKKISKSWLDSNCKV